ncbi:hypothetical protein CEXT_623691 [Caerostris extrusa]|uniref:Uncharacterized protein n=1 Tax=Caerostris extrusa TaxID=172846 RepID=A0AAV4PJ59_CAEEX|nr:hypothetical protein CEXT_623691 [Caerostris extrusa]
MHIEEIVWLRGGGRETNHVRTQNAGPVQSRLVISLSLSLSLSLVPLDHLVSERPVVPLPHLGDVNSLLGLLFYHRCYINSVPTLLWTYFYPVSQAELDVGRGFLYISNSYSMRK